MATVHRLDLGRVRGASRHQKAKKAVSEVRRQVRRTVEPDDIRISNDLNEQLWERGASNPPRSVAVRVVDNDDHVRVEPADTKSTTRDEVTEEPSGEESGTEPGLDEPEQEERQFSTLPDDVKDVLREGTIDEGKEAVRELNKADFELLLDFEEKHQNRKGMKKFLRSNMR